MPPLALVLGAVTSIQFGAALAATLFDDVGPEGTTFLRLGFAALVLLAVWRPRPADHTRDDLLVAGAFGLALGAMNFTFYLALDRVPLGIAVTLEFIGPLGLAVALSRRPVDLLWVAFAAAGVLLLANPFGSGGIDTMGAVLAVVAGGFWAAYIVLAQRAGRRFTGGRGLALAMVVTVVLVAPPGVVAGGGELIDPEVLAIGAAVALLSSAIPYSLETEALRRMRAGVFGILMSLEPMVAALAGFIVLGQDLVGRELAGIVLVVVASAGAAGEGEPPPVEA